MATATDTAMTQFTWRDTATRVSCPQGALHRGPDPRHGRQRGARAPLQFSPQRAAAFYLKVLKSAVANAEPGRDRERQPPVHLRQSCRRRADATRTLRWRPGPQGRAMPFRKRTSHLTVVVRERTPDASRRLTELPRELLWDRKYTPRLPHRGHRAVALALVCRQEELRSAPPDRGQARSASTSTRSTSSAGVPRIEIERTGEAVNIIVHTARPGVLVGRKGVRVDQLKKDLQVITGMTCHLTVREIKRPELEATSVGRGRRRGAREAHGLPPRDQEGHPDDDAGRRQGHQGRSQRSPRWRRDGAHREGARGPRAALDPARARRLRHRRRPARPTGSSASRSGSTKVTSSPDR